MSNNIEKRTNGNGITGFILSVVAVVMAFVKVNAGFAAGWEWIVWGVLCLAAVFSTIGVFRRPRAIAAVGLAIVVVAMCIIYAVAATAAPL